MTITWIDPEPKMDVARARAYRDGYRAVTEEARAVYRTGYQTADGLPQFARNVER